MTAPQPEYGYRFVAQDDLKPEDEHYLKQANKWIPCDAANASGEECGAHYRRRLILPPERMRILGVSEHLADSPTNKYTRDGITWKPITEGSVFTTKEIINFYPNMGILAIAAPIAEKDLGKEELKDKIRENKSARDRDQSLLAGQVVGGESLGGDEKCDTMIQTPIADASNASEIGLNSLNHAPEPKAPTPEAKGAIWNRVSKDCLPDENKPFWSVEKDVVYHYSTGRTRIALHCMADGQPNWTHWMPCNPPFGRPPLPEKDKPEWEVEFDTACDICKTPDFVRTFSKQIYKTALVAAKRKPSILDSVKEEKE